MSIASISTALGICTNNLLQLIVELNTGSLKPLKARTEADLAIQVQFFKIWLYLKVSFVNIATLTCEYHKYTSGYIYIGTHLCIASTVEPLIN